MDRALALPASPLAVSPLAALARLDAKRIAATSVAIAVHVVVLMTLLMPVTTTSAPTIDEQDMTVVPIFKPKPLPLPPPKPLPVVKKQEAQPRPAPVPLQDPPPLAVDDTPSVVDVYVPPAIDVPPTVFDGGPAQAVFAQITADIAPVPPYPAQGLARRLAGEVLLRIRVDASGRPVEVDIERSSGSTLLDEAARKFVKARWHFVPATQDGHAIEAFALLPINYSLPR